MTSGVSGGGAAPPGPVGLSLSGGGYRAMLFHTGSLWRLAESGWLARLDRVSSVSGGSITAGRLALVWDRLRLEGTAEERFAAFREHVAVPIRRLAGRTIDRGAILRGLLPFQSAALRVARAYDEELFDGATLQRLPARPRFVINASNLMSRALWRFSRPYMGDWRIGRIARPEVPLATAVAASSAFPPFLSPLHLDLAGASFLTDEAGGQGDLHRVPFTRRAVLTDGGVYDNLGLETVWKACRTVLVSDAGMKLQPTYWPAGDWFRQLLAIRDVADDQVRSLRKRQVIDAFILRGTIARAGLDPEAAPLPRTWRAGAYWGVGTTIADYGLADPLPCPPAAVERLATWPTRLAQTAGEVQERLINWGYAVTDAALRAYVEPGLAPPAGFPYPGAGIG